MRLAKPDHALGYTESFLQEQLEQFGPDCFTNFRTWMTSQTFAISHDNEVIYYTHDVRRYLDRGGLNARIID